jgi:hypothetical protein
VEEIRTHLVNAGLQAERRSTTIQPLFGATSATGLLANGSNLSVFVFASEQSVDSAFELVSTRRETVTWDATPYFVQVGRNLVVLTTADPAAAIRIVGALVSP